MFDHNVYKIMKTCSSVGCKNWFDNKKLNWTNIHVKVGFRATSFTCLECPWIEICEVAIHIAGSSSIFA